ncbi:hypothetical protein AAAC51_07020 [Priestia megaterium]
MLNFINKEGKKVMEIHDNGETVVLVEDLKSHYKHRWKIKLRRIVNERNKKDNEILGIIITKIKLQI